MNQMRRGAGRARVTAARASRSMAETAWAVRARPPVIHGPRPRVHGVLLSPDVDLASATPGPTGLLYLQQVIGNRTVQRLLVARQQGAPRGHCPPRRFSTRSLITATSPIAIRATSSWKSD